MTWLPALLKSAPAWIYVATVVFFLAYGSWQETKLNRAQAQAEQWRQKAEKAEADKKALAGKLEALNLMLKEFQKSAEEALRRKNMQKKMLAEAKRNDKSVADWSRAPVPDGVRRVLKSGKKRK